VVQLSTPITRLAVMEGRTLAIAAFNSKLDDDFEIAVEDPAQRAEIARGMDEVAARIESDMDPVKAAARMDTDEVVPLGALRRWLCCLVESAWQATGYRRTKNPRIWSLHDLAVLTEDLGPMTGTLPATLEDDCLSAPTAGTWAPAVHVGEPLREGLLLGTMARPGGRIGITAPPGVSGVVTSTHAADFAGFGASLVVRGRATETSLDRVEEAPQQEGLPEGTMAVCSDTDGTFYARPEPDAPTFVEVGARVDARSTLGLIEVMKTFNPVRAPISGEIAKILVSDGDGVEAGQALFWVRTTVE